MKNAAAYSDARNKAQELVSKMTVEEAASQLRYDSPAIERLGIPAYNWWNEALHGLARNGITTVFPQAIALAASFDEKLVFEVADITSTETRAKFNVFSKQGDRDIYKGLTMWAPNINIFRDPRWGRGQETYGEDPFLTATLGKAYVHGLQGDEDILKTAACAKHFAVHSGPEGVRHEFNAEADAFDLEDTYLYAFEELVKEADVEGVMGAYNRVNGEPACASDFLMSKLHDWGFAGYFVSDCWAINDFHTHHMVTSNAVESAAMALNAGCDVNCGCCYVNLIAALEQGLTTEEKIREAAVHLFTTRYKLGMLGGSTPYDDIPYTVCACDEHKQKSYEASQKAIVLLENNGILPLDKSKLKTIAVIGPTATSTAVLEGNYNGTSDTYHTFLEGIKDSFDGRVLYSEGCHLFKDRVSVLAQPDDRLSEAYTVASLADVVILCLGLDATIEGEEGDTGNEFAAGDKLDLRLPESQRRLIECVRKTGKPVIAVVAAGSAINTETEFDALIHAWYSGAEGGRALADILFGRISPSAKLPVTFYKDADELPDFTDYSMKGRTYRYIENGSNVLYPFGFGLTYSKVEVTGLTYDSGNAKVSFKNTGSSDTQDVIELYIKPDDERCRENYHLCGFARVDTKAGQSGEVTVKIPDKAFTFVTEQGERVRAGSFKLYASTHQPDELSCKLNGTDFVSIGVNI
ncbi:glycoside hydrolase family 3 C-terminal domain-containing protein [Ruminococcus sp. NK3A76]|uniref:glycoside hydrolase family 3 C-terminal domain-containing protein n=1 Tax=Ruminococcus sp. NK3A76 TaxID=877411 RepID=UPI000491FBED|nr:glycoside hydrolase family 3 C-terminal domain-containing protein [Ruminococcus sp. NK3A76]